MPLSIRFRFFTLFGLALAFGMTGVHPACCDAQAPVVKADETNPRAAEFTSRDVDADGVLSQQEYVESGGLDEDKVRREYRVYDYDGDEKMTLVEFLTIPLGQPEDQRIAMPDPVILLSNARLAELSKRVTKFDQNGDQRLNLKEFTEAAIPAQIPGLESTKFNDWDLNGDKQLSTDEIARVLNIGFGVCISSGEFLRSNNGRVVDWALFRSLKKDQGGMIDNQEYLRALGPGLQKPQFWISAIDKNGDGRFDYAEFALGQNRTDPVGTFLNLDLDLDGRLSLSELDGLPEGWRQMARHCFVGFDDDHDQSISLREYQLMPHCNILAQWQLVVDANQDGVIAVDEFQFGPGLPLAALAAEYFRRLDTNHNQQLSLDEWTFTTTHAISRFKVLDKDGDNQLSDVELIGAGGLPAKQLSRDFTVFDTNHDGRLSVDEFMGIPHWIPEPQRRAPMDPVVRLSNATIKTLTDRWAGADRNQDQNLSATEFKDAGLGKLVSGLEESQFAVWNLNRDGKLTREEVTVLIEMAYGIRTPKGNLMRLDSGSVIDWRLFSQFRTNAQGFVSRQDYFQALGPLPDTEKQKWFEVTDRNHDGKFNFDEFMTSNHRTDPVLSFLRLDTDFDGKVTKLEMQSLSADQVQIANYVLPGFDDDHDGALSMDEYRLTPFVNLLASWQNAQDANADAKLTQAEFRFGNGVFLAAISAEYFRRLDVDHDEFLTLNEFPFTTTNASAVETELHAVMEDGGELVITIPNYEIIFSPKISPDGKWVALDGWKYGRSHLTAHLLIASLENDEIRDLGTGCLPAWSADTRRLAFCKHPRGVYLRDFEGNGRDEEQLSPNGFGIQFSPDGKTMAYIEQGNFVLQDAKKRTRAFVFPPGKSPYQFIEHNFAWSPDSKRICFIGYRANGAADVGIVAAQANVGDADLRVRMNAQGFQSDFGWHPSGKQILFSKPASNGERMQLYEFDPDGNQPPHPYAKQPKTGNIQNPCWSRDGKIFVYLVLK